MSKIINKDNCTDIGYIKKTHGVKGELMFLFDEGIDGIIENLEYVFFETEGLLVPFFIEEISIHSNISAVILFDTITSKEKANKFVGCKVFIENEFLVQDNESSKYQYIIGFLIVDVKIGNVGIVTEIDNFGGNFVLSVESKGKELLIPFNENLILNLDSEARILTMNLPEGLIEINE